MGLNSLSRSIVNEEQNLTLGAKNFGAESGLTTEKVNMKRQTARIARAPDDESANAVVGRRCVCGAVGSLERTACAIARFVACFFHSRGANVKPGIS
jgi:hypothetical protein